MHFLIQLTVNLRSDCHVSISISKSSYRIFTRSFMKDYLSDTWLDSTNVKVPIWWLKQLLACSVNISWACQLASLSLYSITLSPLLPRYPTKWISVTISKLKSYDSRYCAAASIYDVVHYSLTKCHLIIFTLVDACNKYKSLVMAYRQIYWYMKMSIHAIGVVE